MSQTLTVPRFGGTLIIQYTPATSTVPTLVVQAVFRDGSAPATFRDGKQPATYRDGAVQAGGR